MTYSPTHGSYSSYPMRYALQQQQHQQQSHNSTSHHPHSQPHSQHTPPTHYPKPSYAHTHLHHAQIPIKVEESSDLPPVSSLTNYDHHHVKSASSAHSGAGTPSANHPLFRFGAADFSASASPSNPSPPTPFTFMSHQNWPSSSAASSSYAAQSQYAGGGIDRYTISSPVSPVNGGSHHHALTLADEYDDEGGDELTDLPSAGLGGMGLAPYGAGAGVGGKAGEKQVRRRSSKACDQCRKSKCKCERSSPQEPCRNCVMLGTRKFRVSLPSLCVLCWSALGASWFGGRAWCFKAHHASGALASAPLSVTLLILPVLVFDFLRDAQ